MTPTAGKDHHPATSDAGHGALDVQKLAFWGALTLALAAGGVALSAGPSIGQVGALLFIGVAGLALVFFVWLARGRGRFVGLFPERGAAEAAAIAGQPRAEAALLEAIEEPALLSDRQGGAIAANAAYLALAEAAGALAESERPPMMDRLFGADPVLAAPMYRLARAAGAGERRREELPAAVLRPDADPLKFEASVSPVANGRVLWRLRPRAAAQALADAGDPQARRLFVEDAPLGFFAARPDGAIVYMNQALRALLGYGEEAHLLRLRDFLKEEPSRVLRRDRRGLGGSRAAITLRARDGGEVKASTLSYWPTADGDGACRVLVFLSDTEEMAALSESAGAPAQRAEPVDAFFEHAPYGAAVLDGADPAAATILDANPALMDMAQGRASPGASFTELFEASEGNEALAQRLRRAVGGQSTDLTLSTTPPAHAHVQVTRMGDGRALAFVTNVTEQRDLQQRLAQSEKMREIGLLAGGVAHDFNNLLTVMMQTTDYLLLRHPVGDPDYHELNQINIHALRAKELSEMLRAYARQQTFKVEIIEVAGFVQQMHELARRLAGDTVRVEVLHAANLPFVKVDRAQVERVIVNLITNARDAMAGQSGKPSVLTLRTSLVGPGDIRPYSSGVAIEEGDYVQIEVGDTGAGIKLEDQPKIFHPFHSTKDPGKGTGLGLATSYGIIKQSGGYIFFDSKVGRGTTFRVFLPAYAPNEEELEEMARKEREKAERRPIDVSGRGRILFVEDDDIVRTSIARNLEKFGFEIIQAEDGEDALRILRETPGGFHVVISDVSMPIMTGPEMIKAAGPALGDAKVLLLSGYAPESVQKLIDDITVSHMSKPVGAAELAQRVKELMAA